MKNLITTSIVLTALACAWPAAAQDAAAQAPDPQVQPPAIEQAPARPMNMADMKHHVYVMEGALARAVDYGAKQLNRELTSAMPGAFMLQGDATARGMYLEGYGVVFDVRVPMMSQSMVWSMRMIQEQNDAATRTTISEMRRALQGITDPGTRASMEAAILKMERQTGNASPRNANAQQVNAGSIVMPSAETPGTGSRAAAGLQTVPAAAPSADNMWLKDPNRAYTESVSRAIIDAMIDYSTPMNILAEQWLTVTARDDEGRDSLAPQDPLEEVVTMIYRIKGSDLQLYRSGKIDRDEVRKRVQITQF